MDGSLGKQKLKEYIEHAQPILFNFLDQEMEEAREFGETQVKMMELYKSMITAGKGIRGFLVNLGYQMGGEKSDDAILNASVFIELFHSAILIQDDFMDRDFLRRGLPTAHKEFEKYGREKGVKVPPDHYGNSIAVCLSDVGLYLSWKKLFYSDFPSDRILRASKVYAGFSFNFSSALTLFRVS